MAIRKWIYFGLAVAISLTLCSVSGMLLLAHMIPAEDPIYDLSLFSSEEAVPRDWVYDQKGWTVFTQEGNTPPHLLTPNGMGGFDGAALTGQTFYFSRVMKEKGDNPTLRLDAAERAIAVFLDGALLYTDCPLADNRIGYLNLPMLEWARIEPVVLTLPADYVGRTLTIAQAFPAGGEKQEPTGTVWPCAVTLYCGKAYENDLMAESFQTAVPASLAFAAGLLLLARFTLQAIRGMPDLNALCGGLLAFFWLIRRLTLSLLPGSFPGPVDLSSLSRSLSLILLLVFLACHLTGWRRLFWLFIAAQIIVTALQTVLASTERLTLPFMLAVPDIGLAAVLAALVCGALEWKQSAFFRCFCPLTALGAILWAALGRWSFDGHSSGTLLWPLAGIMTAAALATALAEAIRAEIARRAELQLLARQSRIAQSNYEAMRQQNEQVMMLRHDMMKHFRLLRNMTGEEKTAEYLDELIGQNEKIHPVVQSGNEILDIILNSKLSAAADAGVQILFTRMQAPDKMPLSDAELCSLIMNITDNAVNAASAAERRYIRLDAHIRNNFFVFACENSAAPNLLQKEPRPNHGLGLKIIRQIMERYGNLIKTERGNDFYKVTLLLPLR